MKLTPEQYVGRKIEELETPALVVDLERLENNLQLMTDYCREHDIALWPHTKTHKCIEIAELQIECGAAGLTVAKSEEAEIMAQSGAERILVGYPIYGVEKWTRLATLAGDLELSVAVDSIQTAEGLSAAAKKAGTTIDLLIDLDVGLNRTGVSTPEAAAQLAAQAGELPGLQLRGLFFYPGHIWNPPEKQDAELKAVSAKIQETLELFDKKGLRRDRVSGGSTPAAMTSHRIFGQTETRPGTYLFQDRNYWGLGLCREEDCALTVLTTVISTSVAGRAMLDAGSKTFSGDGWLSGNQLGSGWIKDRSPEWDFDMMSEEHGHVFLKEGAKAPVVGEKVQVIPNHVCPCVNLHEYYFGARNGIVETVFYTDGRGRSR
ncbi:MAG: alanine racemase [Chthoniobacterales bacterium]